ncbi:MAG: hypothetical protein J7M14_02505, partial [Planctomycetes bacterium]|nr:hypothetical protein [Planctomycetota bacterium]
MKRLIALIPLAGLAASAAAEMQTVKCPATRDTGLSAYGSERNSNTGAADRFKLKIWQEFALVDFDVSALKGKRISSARIYLKHTGGAVLGLNGGSDLRWLVVSTVGHDWVEGKCTSLGETPKAGGATFNESSFGKRSWGWRGAKVYDVSLGNGNTLRSQTVLDSVEGYLRADLDVRMVQALVAGASHGLLLMDGSTSVGQNSRVRSREGGDGPFLVVTVAGDGYHEERAVSPFARA